jgi:hypothetical protein
MDLDARVKELMDFKRRAEPMLAAYEKHLQETLGDGAAGTSFETGVTDQNRDEIYAPLKPSQAEKQDESDVLGTDRDPALLGEGLLNRDRTLAANESRPAAALNKSAAAELDDVYRDRIIAEGKDLTDRHRNAIYAANGADLDSVGKTVGVDRK